MTSILVEKIDYTSILTVVLPLASGTPSETPILPDPVSQR